MFALINVKSRTRKGSMVVNRRSKDVGGMGIAAGHLWSCVFDGKRAAMPRLKWCP